MNFNNYSSVIATSQESVLPPGDSQKDESWDFSDVFDAITLADPSFGVMEQPYVEIVEQPAGKLHRFRYKCEGRAVGSIPGAKQTPEKKTYPTIKIHNYIGEVVIVVSCITIEEPYRPHPHKVVGRAQSEWGVYIVPFSVTNESKEYQFKNLGVQCVTRCEMAEALRVRQTMNIDPFKTGFDHIHQLKKMNAKAVRLCFQVLLPDETGRCRRPLPPVVSNIIYDKKFLGDFFIIRASHCSGTVRGGTQVILLCEKLPQEEIAVVFYLEENNEVVWEQTAHTILVHKKLAIAFETPPFRDPRVSDHVTVNFQLKRLTDNARSNSLTFEYIPDYPDTKHTRKQVSSLLQAYDNDNIQYKRKKVSSLLQPYDNDSTLHQPDQTIKLEPRDKPLSCLPQYVEQWLTEDIQGGLAVPGPSNNPSKSEMWGAPSYVNPSLSSTLQPEVGGSMQIGQNLQGLGLDEPAMSYNLQPVSLNMQPLSPHVQILSPQVISPHVQTIQHEDESPLHPQYDWKHISYIVEQLGEEVQTAQAQFNPSAMDTDTSNISQQCLYDILDRDRLELNNCYPAGLSTLLEDSLI